MELTVRLEGVRLHGRHGVLSQEREVGAEFVLDIAAAMPAPAACRTDELASALNYAELYDVALREFAVPSRLLEHVAARIHAAVMERWPSVASLTVSIRKTAPPIPGFSGSASVTLRS